VLNHNKFWIIVAGVWIADVCSQVVKLKICCVTVLVKRCKSEIV